MEVDIKRVAATTTVLSNKSFLVSLINSILQCNSLIIKLSSNINITSSGIHSPAYDNTSLHQLMWILPHDFSILARPWLTLISIDNQISRPGILLPARFIHKAEFHATREPGSSSSSKSRCLDFTDQPTIALEQDILCAMPVAHFLG